MTLLRFLLRSSPAAAILAILAGVVAGASNAALVAYITRTLSRSGAWESAWIWGFVGLCVLLPLTRFASSVLLVKISEKGVHNLRMHLSERVLVHGPSKRDPSQMMGRTDGFKTVILPAGVGAPGELVDVTIARATMATLFAQPR